MRGEGATIILAVYRGLRLAVFDPPVGFTTRLLGKTLLLDVASPNSIPGLPSSFVEGCLRPCLWVTFPGYVRMTAVGCPQRFRTRTTQPTDFCAYLTDFHCIDSAEMTPQRIVSHVLRAFGAWRPTDAPLAPAPRPLFSEVYYQTQFKPPGQGF